MPPKPPAPPGPPARSPQRPASRSGAGKGGPRPRKGATDAGGTSLSLDGEATGPERIAKVLARAGIASRRDAEAIVLEGRVAVNGVVLDTPAVTVGPTDRITVDGQPLPRADRARLWLYHKPAGLVTTARDEQGRDTVFDALPEGLPRVMPVGRLDITSEGLLLLTNDGGLKRKLELPSTGWLRKYRVRVHGTPTDAQLAPLKAGIVIDGERFQPMIVGLDRQQGANAWLTVGLREGKNREIRRAMEAVGLAVNRLIRISYGPFQLGDLAPGAVEEIKPRVLRDQLGLAADPGEMPDAPPKRRAGPGKAAPGDGRGPGPARSAEAPARKSWGMKSHGGAALRAAGTPDPDGRAAPGAGPRSWGRKSHSGAAAAAPAAAPRPPRSGPPSDTGRSPDPGARGKPNTAPGAGRTGPKGGTAARPGPKPAPRPAPGTPPRGPSGGPRQGGPARPKR